MGGARDGRIEKNGTGSALRSSAGRTSATQTTAAKNSHRGARMAKGRPDEAGTSAASRNAARQTRAMDLRAWMRVRTCLQFYLIPNAAKYFAGRRTGFISRLQKMWRVEPVASLRSPSARRIS